MNVINIRYNWPLCPEIPVTYEEGAKEFVCMQFHAPVTIRLANTLHKAKKNAFVVVAPGTPYGIFPLERSVYDWTHALGEVPQNMHIYGLQPNKIYELSDTRISARIFEDLEFNFYLKPYYWWRFSSLKLEELFMNVSRSIGHQRYVNEDDSTFFNLQTIRREMATYPERDWSTEMLAMLLHVSMSRVYPLYKKVFNTTPHSALILMRVEKAKRLLLNNLPITQIASDCGYKNLNHFCRQFKLVTGQTPGDFRASDEAKPLF